ncbi:hypothetical protein SAMN05443252_102123 [Bacillus sp. OV322]|nr:hypothetical protein SAMN05443252_102123 [Bacillus sp. OV322]
MNVKKGNNDRFPIQSRKNLYLIKVNGIFSEFILKCGINKERTFRKRQIFMETVTRI